MQQTKPIVFITGGAGNIGAALKTALKDDYQVITGDMPGKSADIALDITAADSVTKAVEELRQSYGETIAAVIHLAAYFDFSDDPSPLYQSVNVEGTEHLLNALQSLEVERFVYASTMLVHAPCERGDLIEEPDPLMPKWAYPESKAQAEQVIQEQHGNIPYTIIRLAGLYDEQSAVPTLMHQMARIYEQDIKSHLYAGDVKAGQAFIHREDMLGLFRRVVDQRQSLPKAHALLAGEPEVMSYQDIQNRVGELIHGDENWATYSIPQPVAKAGAWLEEKAEPLIPDAYDRGREPFIKPFMVDMASDHYALNIRQAQEQLGWYPRHRLKSALPRMVGALLNDPEGWYEQNRITAPDWLISAGEHSQKPDRMRQRYQTHFEAAHRQSLWAHFLTIALGFWLLCAPYSFGYDSLALTLSDVLAGIMVILTGTAALSPAKWYQLSRFLTALVGLWLMTAPLIFWAPTAAAYLNGTLVGAILFALALVVRPFPAMSIAAAESGPEIPPGWDFTPSSWFQRIPVILLAFVGFYISRYMAAYQLGHIDSVLEPFFAGAISADAKNGTEEIITSPVSEAWPVPDAGLGALTYLLEILTGLIGSNRRWRTMPWLVLLFGFMIIPLGAVSITFIIIQPILLNTWCSLCLIAAAAMLLQIPYSFDEIMATIGFLSRRAKAGRPWLKILFTGDTDEGARQDREEDNFRQPLGASLRQIVTGGISLPWNLAGCLFIGLWLMCTRLTLGTTGGMADADHLIGSLIITITVTALAEVTRIIRLANIFLGMALLITPFIYGASVIAIASSVCCGLAVIALSIRRGPIHSNWGEWTPYIH